MTTYTRRPLIFLPAPPADATQQEAAWGLLELEDILYSIEDTPTRLAALGAYARAHGVDPDSVEVEDATPREYTAALRAGCALGEPGVCGVRRREGR